MIEDVFLGKRENYNFKLSILSQMAESEKWTYAKVRKIDPFRILRNYFEFTYNRLEDENKLLHSADDQYLCMNTGLLTVYNQEIVALFARYKGHWDKKWFLVGFYKASDSKVTGIFDHIPEIADYSKDVKELIYDRNLEIIVQKEHIIDDNYQRFVNVGYADKNLINILLDAAIDTAKIKLARNFKLALPFYYHNGETGENKIQLLIPLYFPGASVKLALVLDRVTQDRGAHYEGITILPVEWAYMNSRVIVRPEEEWARIIDEIDIMEDDIQTEHQTENIEKDIDNND